MNPKVFNTHQEIRALMFQGVKYTQWNLSRSDFLSEHTHTHTPWSWRLNQLIFLRIRVWGSSAGKGSEAIFTISAFIFVLVGASAPLMGLGGGDVAERASTILFPVTFSELLTVPSPFSASVFTGPRSAEGSGSNVWVLWSAVSLRSPLRVRY